MVIPTGFRSRPTAVEIKFDMPQIKTEVTNYGEKLAERTARRNGHGGIISVPYECVGRRYERYIDNTTGIITLIPKAPKEIP